MTQILQRRGARAGAIIVMLLGLAVWALLPPAPRLTRTLADAAPTVRGAYHIHSDRSDGSGSVDDIAAAAGRAGLQFIILTDHGDGTRVPDAPRYRDGVLIIDAVELNTTAGHLVVLGMAAAPYPFAGTPDAVLEDVHRLSGIGIAAHPDSPRPSLQWSAWESAVDGLEWINGDSGWRDESGVRLVRAMLTYWFRAPGTMAALLDRPEELLARWDAMGAARSVPALAAADAHARLGFRRSTDPDLSTVHVPLPGYEAAFRAFSNHVVLDRALTGDAPVDAAAVIAAIRRGRTYTVVDALGTPGGLEFTAASGETTMQMGDAPDGNGAVTLRARMSGLPGATLVMLRDGVRIHDTTAAELVVGTRGEAGVYRVEAQVPGAPGTPPVPWMLSNPIYVGLKRGPEQRGQAAPATPVARVPVRTADVTVEKGERDTGALVAVATDGASDRRPAGEPAIGWRFQLADGVAAGQFAALRLPAISDLEQFDRVRFTVRSAAPMRAWVQLRGGPAAERWGTTFYTDANTRLVDLPLRSFRPIGPTAGKTTPLNRIDALLFVVDTLNSRPGTSGAMTIADVAFVR